MTNKTKKFKKFDFWRSYSAVLTIFALLLCSFLGVFAADDGSLHAYDCLASLPSFSLNSGEGGPAFWYTQTVYGFTTSLNTGSSTVSLSRSGAVLSGSSSGSWSGVSGTSSGISYSPIGLRCSNALGSNIILNIPLQFSSPVSSCAIRGSYTLKYTFSGTVSGTTTYTHTFPGLITSYSEEYNGWVLPLVLPAYQISSSASSGSYTFTVSIDLSNLYIDLSSFLSARDLVLPSGQYLGSDGTPFSGSNVPPYTYLTQGFLGLNSSLNTFRISNHSDFDSLRLSVIGSVESRHRISSGHYAISGGSGTEKFSTWLWSSSTGEEIYRDGYGIISALNLFGSYISNDLAKLRYVLASDDDIEIRKNGQPVKDQITSDFTGDSPAAVKSGDVGDLAGISGDLQGAFNTGANASDAIGYISNGDGWGFFSSAVQDDLNPFISQGIMPTADDGEQQTIQINGEEYLWFYDPSVVDAYLGGDR